MGYSEADLIVFELLRDKGILEGTSYFELHPGELPEPIAYWLEGSIFMKDAGFDFFVGAFEQAHHQFDYFASEVLDATALDALDHALAAFDEELIPGCSRELVFSRYNSLFNRSIWDAVDTESLRRAVTGAVGELRAFVGRVRAEEKRLWVIGM